MTVRPAEFGPLCEHHECRCARARELSLMAGQSGDALLLEEAFAAHWKLVRCRREPVEPPERF